MPVPTLTADRLTMRFGRRLLFQDLTFEARAGEALAITGANGSGKSTLLKILAGVLEPTGGAVHLQTGPRSVPPHERPLAVGFVAPYLNLYDGFSAHENLAFLGRARRLPDRAARIAAVLDRVGLAGRFHEPLSAYSTGMRQRVRIAAALLHEPPVLLLDEPSATLDEAGRSLVRSLLTQPDRVVVVATNDPDEASRCAVQLAIDDEPVRV